MKLFKTFFLTAVAASSILSASTIVTADLVNAGSPVVFDSGNNAVGPYTLKVNGVNYAAMCMDYLDNATIGQNYSAYETQLGTSLTNTYHSTSSTLYAEEAYLMTLITKSGADRTDIQDAAWWIFDNNLNINSTARGYVNQAAANYQGLNLSGFQIISGTNASNCNRPQEFIIDPGTTAATPEPATVLLLGGGLVVAGMLRKRKKAVNN